MPNAQQIADAAGEWDELRIMREAKGFRLSDLARAAGLSRSYLGRLEAGLRPSNPRIVKQLADALGVPTTMLGNHDAAPQHG